MMNSVFREWDFHKMGLFLRENKKPIGYLLGESDDCWGCEKYRTQYYPHDGFIIVYLEDFIEEKGKYKLLLDFFTPSDLMLFIRHIGSEEIYKVDNEKGNMPRSTFFTIDNYKSVEKPVRGSHYYLNLWELNNTEVTDALGYYGFPLLFTITLNEKTKSERLLYMTMPLTYPQTVFSVLQGNDIEKSLPSIIADKLLVWDVGQGNYNELKASGEPYIIYDAGTDVFGENGVSKYKSRLVKELTKGIPLFVLSHWHADHYSLLFSLDNSDLKKIGCFVFPSYVRSLSIFLFITRLKWMNANVVMKMLPFVNKWEGDGGQNIKLYANRYVTNKPNESGLTLFVKGMRKNAMLPGDCRYITIEGQANDACTALNAEKRDWNLVVPHHGGNAGKTVTFNVKDAGIVDGIVSVGKNRYGHPKKEVVDVLKGMLGSVRMTECEEDREGKEYIEVEM